MAGMIFFITRASIRMLKSPVNLNSAGKEQKGSLTHPLKIQKLNRILEVQIMRPL